jgi:hypothetical protein
MEKWNRGSDCYGDRSLYSIALVPAGQEAAFTPYGENTRPTRK